MVFSKYKTLGFRSTLWGYYDNIILWHYAICIMYVTYVIILNGIVLYYTIFCYTNGYCITLVVHIVYCDTAYLTVLCGVTLYYTYCIILYHTVLYSTMLYKTVLYDTMLYYTVLYTVVLYYTVLYFSILYYIILYYIILMVTVSHSSIISYTDIHRI